MTRKLLASSLLALLLAILPALAQAQSGYAAKTMNMRAGPARDYPLVAMLPAGIPLVVLGCVADYHWCDVEAGPNRGWVYAANIAYPYQGANVSLLTYGSVIGIGIVAFSVASYWDTHYHGRPWYRQREHWVGRQGPAFRHEIQGPVHRPGVVAGGPRPLPGAGPGPGPGPGGHRAVSGPGAGAGGHRPAPGPGMGPGGHGPAAGPGPAPGGRGPAPGPGAGPGGHAPAAGPGAGPGGHPAKPSPGAGPGSHAPKAGPGTAPGGHQPDK